MVWRASSNECSRRHRSTDQKQGTTVEIIILRRPNLTSFYLRHALLEVRSVSAFPGFRVVSCNRTVSGRRKYMLAMPILVLCPKWNFRELEPLECKSSLHQAADSARPTAISGERSDWYWFHVQLICHRLAGIVLSTLNDTLAIDHSHTKRLGETFVAIVLTTTSVQRTVTTLYPHEEFRRDFHCSRAHNHTCAKGGNCLVDCWWDCCAHARGCRKRS